MNKKLTTMMMLCSILLTGCATIPMQAVQKNSVKEVEEAIKKGAKVNTKDNEGNTLLMVAVANNAVSVAKLLIKEGAENQTCNATGLTALGIAASKGHLDMVKLLLENMAYVEGAYRMGSLSDCVFNETQMTPLMFAVENNSLEIAKLLIEKGADVNALRGTFGNFKTALSLAETNSEMASFLRKHGAKTSKEIMYKVLGVSQE